MTEDTIIQWLKKSIEIFYKKDLFLVKNGVAERAITHRIGMYLQQIIGDSLDVDCEYNRMGYFDNENLYYTEGDYFAKRVCLSEGLVSDESDLGSRVFPDIIIHKRGTAENLSIIEIKVNGRSGDIMHDFKKLKRYKKELKYKYAIFIELFRNIEDVHLQFV
ncbi:hypothetical protein [Flagellimonas sediminis]|uniref:GxxExxY protein n=1 Tax=Flagellimonas sediminis TaxID=2696468 RepID=A0A6I5KNJ2_9FLAO|nr:hypothetical protein [Allomuricauda sediminis]NDV42067.1 hypothetical protein [Allomuricauda sediminis]